MHYHDDGNPQIDRNHPVGQFTQCIFEFLVWLMALLLLLRPISQPATRGQLKHLSERSCFPSSIYSQRSPVFLLYSVLQMNTNLFLCSNLCNF